MEKSNKKSLFLYLFIPTLISLCAASTILINTPISNNVAAKANNSQVNSICDGSIRLGDIIDASSGTEYIENIYFPITYDTETKEYTLENADIFRSFDILDLSFKETAFIDGQTYTLTEFKDNFFSNVGLTGTLTIPNGVKTICSHAFSGNPDLSTLILGNDVEVIKSSAFGSCGITNLNIPSKVKEIGEDAFTNDNTNNITVTFNWTTQAQFDQLSISSNWINTNYIQTIYVPIGTEQLYRDNLTKLNISTSVQIKATNYVPINADDLISNAAGTIYYGLNKSNQIFIHSSENVVCTNPSFYSSLSIANTSYPVTNISASAFKDNSNLYGNLVIPSSITVIGENAFANCIEIDSMELSWDTTTAEDIVSSGSLNPNWTGDPNSTTSLNREGIFAIFDGNYYDAYTKLQDGLSIGKCTWLTDNTRLSTIMTDAVGVCYLYDQKGNTEIINTNFLEPITNPSINSSVYSSGIYTPITSIRSGAFANQNSLFGEFTIPSNIVTIGTNAFDQCKNLNSFSLNWSTDQLDLWFAENTNTSKIDTNWLGDLNNSTISIHVPEGSLKTYQKYALQLGIDKCKITSITNFNFSLSLGLGIGIPTIFLVVLSPVLIRTSYYNKIKKIIKKGQK